MLILLPPSETKAIRVRGAPLDLESLSSPGLLAARRAVIDALARVSADPDAARQLGVSPNLTAEIARNTRLETAPTLRAGEVYTGVLYDALDLAGLDPSARRRAARRIVIVSAVFGALRLTDRVPPYRLSMGVNLPGVGPLAGHWRAPLAQVMDGAASRGLIIDCRSSTYAAAWTPPPGSPAARRWVQIHVPGATHMAKQTRGLVARALCENPTNPTSPQGLVPLLKDRFDVSIHEPSSVREPWVLSARATPQTHHAEEPQTHHAEELTRSKAQ
ncbi:MAG: peroxide stress protein YaaA [Ornithinimicrobium sp.]